MPIYNGRSCAGTSISTIGPPLQLFHPVFAHFLDDISNENLEVPAAVLNATYRFLKKASILYTTEIERRRALEVDFCTAISYGCIQIVNLDGTSPDSSVISCLGAPINETAISLLHEIKREPHDGDGITQVQLSHNQFWGGDPVCILSLP